MGKARHGSRNRKLAGHIFSHTQEGERIRSRMRPQALKAHPQQCTSSSKAQPPKRYHNLPKQHHLLRTKCSNTRNYRGQFFKQPHYPPTTVPTSGSWPSLDAKCIIPTSEVPIVFHGSLTVQKPRVRTWCGRWGDSCARQGQQGAQGRVETENTGHVNLKGVGRVVG